MNLSPDARDLLHEYAWTLSDSPTAPPRTVRGLPRLTALSELSREGLIIHTIDGPKLTANGVIAGSHLLPSTIS